MFCGKPWTIWPIFSLQVNPRFYKGEVTSYYLQWAAEIMGLYHSTKYTPSVSPFGLPAPSEREPRRLRRSGRLRASPTVGGGNHGVVPFNEVHSLSQPVRAASSLREGAKGASRQRGHAPYSPFTLSYYLRPRRWALPGESRHYRIGIIPVASLSGGTAAKNARGQTVAGKLLFNYLFSISFRASLRLKLARPFSSKPMNLT